MKRQAKYENLLEQIMQSSNLITKSVIEGDLHAADLYRIILNISIDNAIKMINENGK